MKFSPLSAAGLGRLALICATTALAIGALALAGWISDLPILASFRAHFIPMAPATALSFICTGMALVFVVKKPAWPWVARTLAGMVLVLAVARLGALAYDEDSGLDRWLVHNPGHFGAVLLGRMSPITALNLVLIELGVLGLNVPALRRFAGSCGALVAMVGLGVMVSYWYGTPLLYGGSIIPVALSTATGFFMCGVGVITAAGRDSWPLKEFMGESTRALLLRHFMPFMVLIALFMGWMRAMLITHLPANPAALSAFSALISMLLVIWIVSRVSARVGGKIDEAEQARARAQAELRALNEELERRVSNRTRELRARNRQMEEELQMARELQISLLPRQFPTLPPDVAAQESALGFLSLYFPTSNVSGDFFTVVPVSDKSVGIFICDVMGHGVRSALLTTMIRALVEEHAPRLSDPGEMLSRVNQGLSAILSQSGTTMFATGFYLIVDVETAQLRYASAGHPAPFHIASADSSVHPLNGTGSVGPAMGLFPHAKYKATRRPLRKGDFVMLFTDGLFEVESDAGELFSEQQLLETVRRQSTRAPQDMLNRVVDEVRDFSHGKRFSDDVCVVGVQVLQTG